MALRAAEAPQSPVLRGEMPMISAASNQLICLLMARKITS